MFVHVAVVASIFGGLHVDENCDILSEMFANVDGSCSVVLRLCGTILEYTFLKGSFSSPPYITGLDVCFDVIRTAKYHGM